MKKLIIILIAVVMLTGCATNYYGSRGYYNAEYEVHAYVKILNQFNFTVYSGYATVYHTENYFEVNGKKYSKDRYTLVIVDFE